MEFEELQQAIESFNGKTDVRNKGVALSELTSDEVDAGASSKYFNHYGN